MTGQNDSTHAAVAADADGSLTGLECPCRVIELADALDGVTAGVIELLAAFGEVQPDPVQRLRRAA